MFGAVIYMRHSRVRDVFYSLKYGGLFKPQIYTFDDCVDLSAFPCYTRSDMNAYVFWTKFVVIYYLSIIVAMIYTWHRTIRLSSCLFVLLVSMIAIVRTELILYFNQIVPLCFMICFMLIFTFATLEMYVPHRFQDPLSVFCAYHSPPYQHCEYLKNDISRPARFYRWTKKMKKQWNIEDEKIFISTFVGIIVSVLCVILCVYFV